MIAMLRHTTMDAILAARSACAILDKGIDRYLSRSMIGEVPYGRHDNGPDNMFVLAIGMPACLKNAGHLRFTR